jgi:hypothetical protein
LESDNPETASVYRITVAASGLAAVKHMVGSGGPIRAPSTAGAFSDQDGGDHRCIGDSARRSGRN